MAGTYPKVKQGRLSMKRANGALSLNQKSDSELIRCIADHSDRDAFSELFKRYEKLGYQVARHVASDHHIAEEAVLDGMHSVWRSACTFKYDRSARGWIICIIARSSLKRIQRKTRRGKMEQEDVDSNRKAGALPEDSQLESLELMAGLKNQLDGLPVLDRNIIALRYVGGLSQEEIGKELAIPQRTVSDRIKRTLENLRKSLTQAGLAAALPLVSAEGIGKAICMESLGHPALLEKALIRMVASDARVNQRSVWWVSVPLAFVAMACVGFVWSPGRLTSSSKQQAASPLKETSASGGTIGTEFYRYWNFNKPDLGGLNVIAGAWDHLPGSGPDGSGCITPSSDINLFLGIKLSPSELPVEMCANIKMQNDGISKSLLQWGRQIPDVRIQGGIQRRNHIHQWVKLRCFITRKQMDVWVDGKLYRIVVGDQNKEEQLIVNIMSGWKIDDLEIRGISSGAIPDTSLYLKAMARIAPDKRQQFHLLPALTEGKSANNKAELFIVYFQNHKPNIDLESKRQRWKFHRSKDLLEFSIIGGDWKYVAKGGKDGTGCVEMLDKMNRITFDCNNRKAPFVVTLRFRGHVMKNKYILPNLCWHNFSGARSEVPVRISGVRINRHQPWVTVRYYVTNQYIDAWAQNQRIAFKINKIDQKGLPYFDAVYKTQVDYLEIKPLRVKDLPKLGALRAEVNRIHLLKKGKW